MKHIVLNLVTAMLVSVSSVQAEPPSPNRGLYAIWYGKNEELLNAPYIVGGQIVVQWADVEPGPGRYDFSGIAADLKKLTASGKKITIQINGNLKPTWLFSKVPVYPGKLSPQVRDPQGTLMYWHPTFRKAYTDMLKAFGGFLAQNPDRKNLAGIRLNFDAIGTEHMPVPPEAQDLSRWTVPAGADPFPAWSKEQVWLYEKEVVDTYVTYVAPQAKVLVRNNVDPEIEKLYRPLFASGQLGWFHTSTEAEPRSGEVEAQYRRFYEDCRSGQTVGYAEPWASAWGLHGGKRDDRSCSPPQWNYWRLLVDLHCGVSFIALYANDLSVALTGENTAKSEGADKARPAFSEAQYSETKERRGYQKEFDAAFRFAAKYVGFHASPEISPGAWVAFRENHEALAKNAKETDRHLSFITGDYSFLMERLPDQTQPVHNIGPENQRQGAWARVLSPTNKLELKLNPRFAASLKGAKVQVTYLDRSEDTGSPFQIIANQQVLNVHRLGSDRWETAELELPNGPLAADSHGAHIVVTAGTTPVYLHLVEVTRR